VNVFIKRFLPPKILFLVQNRHLLGAFLRAYLLVHRIKLSTCSPFHKAPRTGYLRGIDFYKGWRLIPALAFAMWVFRRSHGVYPNLLQPAYFDEKLFKLKFFTELKIPESGNKLLTSEFIPAELKTSIGVAEIIWHSPMARLPRNDEILPGAYFLKASHGAGMFKKIRYPLREDEFVCLERVCQEWLENSYGLTTGEWWYSTFQKEILIEEQVGTEDNPISWHFYTFDGVVGHIMAHRKSASDPVGEFTLFDGSFDILADPKMRRSITGICLTQDTKEQLRRHACLIGGQFSFVRVDFLVDDDQKIYLGELTFCPGNAANGFFSDKLQLHLGSLWSQLSS
jgi:hypothetical protein